MSLHSILAAGSYRAAGLASPLEEAVERLESNHAALRLAGAG